jgi:CHAT domain-containing protein
MNPRFRYLILAIVALIVAIAMLPLTSVVATPNARPATVRATNDARIIEIEEIWKAQYVEHLNAVDPGQSLTAEEIRATMAQLGSETQSKFALLYIFPQPEHLELVLVIPGTPTVHRVEPDVPLKIFTPIMDAFQMEISHPTQSGRSLNAAQQLYQWMVAPLKPTLDSHSIDTLIFCVGAGVRSAPLAALHDGQRFLVEEYSVAVIPAFSLTDARYDRVAETRVLAMGASEFDTLKELPAVPLELSAIARDLWNGEVFLNEEFTQENLAQQLNSGQFAIVHLATHASFESGEPEESYIQLWKSDRIGLHELPDLGWRDRPIELLVLSACQTALGDRQAELGFAGLSFQSGVKSTLASLWYVSDLGTLALMREFYWQLSQSDVTTKAEALRRAQMNMLRGEVRIEQGQVLSSAEPLSLPSHLDQHNIDVSTPYHWAGFTLVGSPW